MDKQDKKELKVMGTKKFVKHEKAEILSVKKAPKPGKKKGK